MSVISLGLSLVAEALICWTFLCLFSITQVVVVLWASMHPAGFSSNGLAVSILEMAQFVIVAPHRSESIIMGSAGWGVGGRSGQRSRVFSAGMWAAWIFHEEFCLLATKNSSVDVVGVRVPMGMAVVL